MKPSHVNAFARYFLNGLPTSFKQTIIVCEKLASGEVVIKDTAGSLSRIAKMMNFLKGATAVGVVTANGELLINIGSFIKSLVDHGGSKTMDITIDKMKFEACCNFKCEHDEKLNEIKESVVEMKTSLGKQMEEGNVYGSQDRANLPERSAQTPLLSLPAIPFNDISPESTNLPFILSRCMVGGGTIASSSPSSPGHVNAFARYFLNGLPTSFKQTIIVCEKLASEEVVMKDTAGSLSRNAKMMNFLKGAIAVGVVTANGELLINTCSFIKSLVDHGGSKTMDIAINKMKFEACCNF
ncbi:unnamed protein product [Prunus armeniaca]|uniref:Uncharacterized protein n=1 Tax=Prunus armeniaca TaxID=36596 RepID=A0A6J5UCB5_PRUAR|nr:unnamed protein product [Prunus armeniaca]